MTPDLSKYENLHCDLQPEPELREFGELAKRIAHHLERYHLEDQAFSLARLLVIAGYHMGRDHRDLMPEIERSYGDLLTMLAHDNESGLVH